MKSVCIDGTGMLVGNRAIFEQTIESRTEGKTSIHGCPSFCDHLVGFVCAVALLGGLSEILRIKKKNSKWTIDGEPTALNNTAKKVITYLGEQRNVG